MLIGRVSGGILAVSILTGPVVQEVLLVMWVGMRKKRGGEVLARGQGGLEVSCLEIFFFI